MIDKIDSIESRPSDLNGKTFKIESACGSMYVTINLDNGDIFEIFANSGKSGSCSAAMTDALTKMISISLRAGVPAIEILDRLDNIRCPKSNSHKSCPEAIAEAMRRLMREENMEVDEQELEDAQIYDNNWETEITYETTITQTTDTCPECDSPQYNPASEGCAICPACGYSPCG